MEENNNNDEIDLGPLFKWIQGLFNSLWTSLKNWLMFVWAKRIKVFMLSIIGALICIGVTFLIDPYYNSNITFVSHGIDSKLHFDKIVTINNLLEEDNAEEVGLMLNLPTNEIKKLRSVELNMNRNTKVDSINKPIFFKIDVTVFDNFILDTLEFAMLQYLSDIEFAKRNSVLQRNRLTKLINKLDKEIEEIDSLKKIVAKSISPIQSQKGFIYGEPIDPVAVYKEGVRLYERKLNLEMQIQSLEPVDVVTSFSKHSKKAFPKKSHFAIVGFAAGLIFSLIYYSGKKAVN